MKNLYRNFINRTVPVIWVLVLNLTFHVVAQQNESKVLSAENTEKTEAEKTPKVFIQPFTSEKNPLTGEGTIQYEKFPVFIQKYAIEKDQLYVDKPYLKSARKAVTTVSPVSGEKDMLTVSGSGTILMKALSASEGPIGTPDHYAVPTDQILSIAAPGFLANDIDLDGEALTATLITDGADHGDVIAFTDGRLIYTPYAGFIGTDQFSYQMQNASGITSDPVPVTIEVLPAANRNPIGISDNYAMTKGSILSVSAPGFIGNDIDLDGEAITATLIMDAADHGGVIAFTDGSFTYTPDADFTGTDQFAYQMRDASNNYTGPVTVTIQVYESNRAPIGVDDHYAAVINTTLNIAAPGFLAMLLPTEVSPIRLMPDLPELTSLCIR